MKKTTPTIPPKKTLKSTGDETLLFIPFLVFVLLLIIFYKP
jgi:hypothetical protein